MDCFLSCIVGMNRAYLDSTFHCADWLQQTQHSTPVMPSRSYSSHGRVSLVKELLQLLASSCTIAYRNLIITLVYPPNPIHECTHLYYTAWDNLRIDVFGFKLLRKDFFSCYPESPYEVLLKLCTV